MDSSVNNPAGRLHKFLAHCWSQDNTHPLHAVWSGYLIDQETHSPDYASALAVVASLPGQIRSAVNSLPDNAVLPKSFLLNLLPRYEDILLGGILNQQITASGFRGQFNLGDLAQLEMLSHILTNAADDRVTGDVLNEIRDLADQIAQLLIEDDTIDGELRELLDELSRGIRTVIESYSIRGPQGIARERDLLMGRLMNNPALTTKLMANKKATHLVKKTLVATGVALSFFNTSTTAADNVPKAIEHVQHVVELASPVGDAAYDAIKQLSAPREP